MTGSKEWQVATSTYWSVCLCLQNIQVNEVFFIIWLFFLKQCCKETSVNIYFTQSFFKTFLHRSKYALRSKLWNKTRHEKFWITELAFTSSIILSSMHFMLMQFCSWLLSLPSSFPPKTNFSIHIPSKQIMNAAIMLTLM